MKIIVFKHAHASVDEGIQPLITGFFTRTGGVDSEGNVTKPENT